MTLTTNINYKGIELEVEFDYFSGCGEQRYERNGDPGHPAEPEELAITDVNHKGVSIYEFLKNTCLVDEIEVYMVENKPEREQ